MPTVHEKIFIFDKKDFSLLPYRISDVLRGVVWLQAACRENEKYLSLRPVCPGFILLCVSPVFVDEVYAKGVGRQLH